MDRFNTFSGNVKIRKLEKVRENATSILERGKTLRSLKRLILKDKDGKQHCLPFYWF